MWRKGHPFALLVAMQIVEATVESSMKISQKFLNHSAFWLSYLTSGNISEGTQNTNSKEHKHSYVHCSIIYNGEVMEAAQVSINRWVDKTIMGHLHNRILLSRIIEENFILCDSMDGPGEHYGKWNKPVRRREIPYDFTHMWNLTKNVI